MASTDFSILISTRDRAARLEACLDHLLALDEGGSREFLIVDNGSRDATASVLERFRADCPWPVTLLREERPGVSWGLNRGLARARGDLLFFTDDDCYADPGLLAAYATIFADPRIGYAGGQIRLHNPADIRLAVQEAQAPRPLPAHGLIWPGIIQGGNMAFRRAALAEIGGFDPNFGAGARFSGFDIDACTRASEAGWHGLYHPLPLVHHDHGRRAADWWPQVRRYSEGGGAYFAKRLIQSRSRLRDLGTITAFTLARRNPIPMLYQARGFARYVALRLAGRLEPVAPQRASIAHRAGAGA